MRGVLKANFLEEMYENKLEFPGGGGCKTKNLPWGEYGYFLELRNVKVVVIQFVFCVKLFDRLLVSLRGTGVHTVVSFLNQPNLR